MADQATVNFADLAQIRAGDVERPKALPQGKYLAHITGPMTQHKAAKTGNVAMRFPCQIDGPADNEIDMNEYQAAMDVRHGKPVTFNLDFWMSPDARYRFTDFAVGAQGASDDLNLIELAEYLVGEGNKPFVVTNKPRQDEEKEDVWYNDFQNPIAAE